MDKLSAGWIRRLTSTAVAAVLAVAGSTVAIVTPSSADAATGWFMLVNDYYDGTPGRSGDGKMRCLSTNNQPASSNGTHMVYLAGCNAANNAQWWHLVAVQNIVILQNWVKDDDGNTWELSSNKTPPPGYSGIYSAYTARTSNALGHYWSFGWYDDHSGDTNKYTFQGAESFYFLSASHANPYSGNTYRVYTSAGTRTDGLALPTVQQQVWRKFTPPRPA